MAFDLSKLTLRAVATESRSDDNDREDRDSNSEWSFYATKEFEAVDGNGVRLAKIVAHTVDRDSMIKDPAFTRIGFTMMLDPISDEMLQFGTLFDAAGRLRQKHRGLWGVEMDTDAIGYIEEVYVPSPDMRGKGIGTWAVQKVLQHEWFQACRVICCWPTLLPKYETNCYGPIRDERIIKIVSWARKAGFRRIGHSEFFAFSRDAKHPSRSMTIEEDAAIKSPADLEKEFPMHAIIAKSNPFDPQRRERLLRALSSEYKRNPDAILLTDPSGDTPLHFAISNMSWDGAAALLQLDSEAQLRTKDKEGRTPYENLIRTIENFKSQVRPFIPSDFQGMLADEREYERVKALLEAKLKHNKRT